MLDASEMDRIVELTKVPLGRLVDWKNRAAEPFELRLSNADEGAYDLTLNTPEILSIPKVVVLVHGDYESRKEEDGTLVYTSMPGNTMGQATTNDGRPAFAAAYDMTALDEKGRPVFKVYFGSGSEWFVKNVYHQKWNDLREVRRELEPDTAPAPVDDGRVGKERGQNPRALQRQQEREQRHGGGGSSGGGASGGGASGGRTRRGRRGGRGRGGDSGGDSAPSGGE